MALREILPAAPDAAPATHLPGQTAVPHSALAWMLAAPAPSSEGLSPDEASALCELDALLAMPQLPAALLPRAASVVPHLLAIMRQEAPSRGALVQQVAKDPVLAAEVLRMAHSPHYRTRVAVDSLDAAVTVIGTTGLQSAVARIVLRPVFEAHGDGLAARGAARNWQHAERKALQCLRLAGEAGVDRFEGFLAGLLHNTGWTVALRALDRAGIAPDLPFSIALDEAIDRRKDRLFARLALEWQITPDLTALATSLEGCDLSSVAQALAQVLHRADLDTTAQLSIGVSA
jgi:hypothetical protein